MMRTLCLVLAGFVASSIGCSSIRSDGKARPARPRLMAPDTYAHIKPTHAAPGLVGGRVAIAGGRIVEHGVYIDMLVEAPETRESYDSLDMIDVASFIGDSEGERWFTLANAAGEPVRFLPREAAAPEPSLLGCGFGPIPFVEMVEAAPGEVRWIIVVRYHTKAQLEPGTHMLFIPEISDAFIRQWRDMLGLEAFDNTPIDLRYAAEYEPDAAND